MSFELSEFVSLSGSNSKRGREILVILLSSICESESESEDEEMVNKMKKKRKYEEK